MNQMNIEKPAIRSYAIGNYYAGITNVMQYIGLRNPQLPSLNHDEFVMEIEYDAKFLHKTMEPIVSEITSLYSQEVAGNVVNSLLMHGMSVGIINYANLHRRDFSPAFNLGNTTLVPNFEDIYRKLIEYFPHQKVDEFCNHIMFYGLALVRDTEDTRCIFGNQSVYNNVSNPQLN